LNSFLSEARSGFTAYAFGNSTMLGSTLHAFSAADGIFRQPRLTLGPDRNPYGTLRDGGALQGGELFQITTNGVFTALVSFSSTNGAFPLGELTTGADRQLYGTTFSGGTANLGTVSGARSSQ